MFLFVIGLLLAEGLFAQKIRFFGKFVVEKGDMDKAVIHITKNGSPVRTITPQGQKFEFDCEVNSEYIFSFEKPGYITKRISINTYVIEDRMNEGFDPFRFNVYLFPQLEGVNTVMFNQPVGKIMYKEDLDDIGYDTDYTKSIEAQMKEFEAQYKAKEQEVPAQPPPNPTAQVPSNPIQPAPAVVQQNVPSPLPPQMEASPKPEKTVVKPSMAPATDVDPKKAFSPSFENDYKKYSTGSEDAEKRKALLAAEDQARRDRELAAMSEDEKRRNRIAATIEEIKRNQYPKPPQPSYQRTENYIKEPKREIMEIILSGETVSIVYRKVKCDFGGEFYFKNNSSISKWVFENAFSTKIGK